MKNQRKSQFLIAFVLIGSLLLSACTQPASQAPADAGVSAGNETQVQNIIQSAATQTAIAATLGSEGGGGANLEQEQTAEATQPEVATATATTNPPTSTPAPTLALSVPNSYTLHKGEFPYCIARRFNIDAITLLNVNGLTLGQQFSEGLTLTIPQGGAQFGGDRSLINHPDDYTVQSGDTFYTIACKYGDPWPEAIAQANGMKVGDSLTPGEVIHIP
jgi:LysM repeat protein